MRGCSGGVRACVVALGGHVWLLWGCVHGCSWGGMRGCSRGACVVAPGGHVWLLWGGALGDVHGFFGGACMVFLMRYGQ